MQKALNNIRLTKKTIYRLKLVDSAGNFVELLSICAIIIISASVFNLTGLVKSSRVFFSTEGQTVTTSGAKLTPPTPEELRQYQLIQNLYTNLPVRQNTFIIDFDFLTDRFRVVLIEPYATSRANFDSWKNANYSELGLTNFTFVNFAPAHSGPHLLSVMPYYSEVDKTVNFTTLLFDGNGSTDITTVNFGLTPCDVSQASSGNSEFERRLANYFGFTYLISTNNGSLANKNPSQGCSNSAGTSPWTAFTNASNVNMSNYPNTSKLLSITKTNLGKILRVSWNVSLNFDFIPSDFAAYNYYFMAKDSSGIWNTGSTTPKWSYAGKLELKRPATSPTPTVTVKPGDVDRDGDVDILDFQGLSNSFGLSQGQSGYNPKANFNGDTIVDILDFQLLSNNFGL